MDAKRICLVGVNGQMGQALLTEIKADKSWSLVSCVGRNELVKTISQLSRCDLDIVIDFSTPQVTVKSARYCAEHHLPLVTGTTGLSQKQMNVLKKCAQKIPILWSANMCLAVNLLARVLADFNQMFPGADIEITEQHHRDKKDSPSGTALFFAQAMNPSGMRKVVCGRPEGHTLGRDSRDITINSLRGGKVPGGFNEVRFLMGDEEVILGHRIFSNQGYAQGALVAAKWLLCQSAGLYSMLDVFAFKQ